MRLNRLLIVRVQVIVMPFLCRDGRVQPEYQTPTADMGSYRVRGFMAVCERRKRRLLEKWMSQTMEA